MMSEVRGTQKGFNDMKTDVEKLLQLQELLLFKN